MTNFQEPFERRRGELERTTSMYGRVHKIHGFVELAGSGETIVDVKFPVWFTERPAISGGGELGEGAVLEEGSFPIFSAGVVKWVYEEKAGGARYYTGAQLVLVALGPADAKSIVHWQLEGKALRNPLNDLGDTDDPV